jgi:hypothetical protein
MRVAALYERKALHLPFADPSPPRSLRPPNDKNRNLDAPLRLTPHIVRPRLDVPQQLLPQLRRARRPVDMAIATLCLGLLGIAHHDLGHTGLLLLRPPVLGPRGAAQRHFSGRRVDDGEVGAGAVEAGHCGAALGEMGAEGGDSARQVGVAGEEVDGGHGAEGLAELGRETVCGDGRAEDGVEDWREVFLHEGLGAGPRRVDEDEAAVLRR